LRSRGGWQKSYADPDVGGDWNTIKALDARGVRRERHRPEGAVAWVPIGDQETGSVGLYVEADRAADVKINARDSVKVTFENGHHTTVLIFDR
jgi:hypothetical protein